MKKSEILDMVIDHLIKESDLEVAKDKSQFIGDIRSGFYAECIDDHGYGVDLHKGT